MLATPRGRRATGAAPRRRRRAGSPGSAGDRDVSVERDRDLEPERSHRTPPLALATDQRIATLTESNQRAHRTITDPSSIRHERCTASLGAAVSRTSEWTTLPVRRNLGKSPGPPCEWRGRMKIERQGDVARASTVSERPPSNDASRDRPARLDGNRAGPRRRERRQQLWSVERSDALVTVPGSPLSGDTHVIVTNSPNTGVVIATWLPAGGTSTQLIESFAPSRRRTTIRSSGRPRSISMPPGPCG
jgi:hypothetical protein